jgi:hypothetical protein
MTTDHRKIFQSRYDRSTHLAIQRVSYLVPSIHTHTSLYRRAARASIGEEIVKVKGEALVAMGSSAVSRKAKGSSALASTSSSSNAQLSNDDFDAALAEANSSVSAPSKETHATTSEKETAPESSSSTNSNSNSSSSNWFLYDAVWGSLVVYSMYLACRTAYRIRLGAINEYGPVIHEFDPYFNFRATEV